MKDPVSSDGFLLLDSGMNPTFFDRTAAEVLSYPQKPDAQKNLQTFLTSKIRSTLLSRSSREPVLVTRFRSGRRVYQCHSYRLDALTSNNPQASIAVVLERGSRASSSLVDASERFHLTAREKEVVQYLFHGLTTKEIAGRLQISPNTVKAFLRLVMVKMEVSTRSGIVGKALTSA
jgi:DNA-binding CsgD family transcriptional regulator